MTGQTHPKHDHIKSASLVQLPGVDVDGVDHGERVRCTHDVADLKRTKLIHTIGRELGNQIQMPLQWSWLIADRCPDRFSDKDKTQSADSDSGKQRDNARDKLGVTCQ